MDPGINESVLAYARHLLTHPEVIECIPAYASLLVTTIGKPETDEAVREAIYSLKPRPREGEDTYLHELPVLYGGSFGPDFKYVAEHCNLMASELIRLHTSATFLVYFMGFRPGFGFMGQTDERLEVPRRNDPRTSVPSGSVALAGRQTSIYPDASPGGWQLIGRCPYPLLGDQADLTRLRAGDRVRFYSVSQLEYERLMNEPSPWPQR